MSTKSLLNGPERILYGRLVRAFPGHVIFAQVALSRLLAADRTPGLGEPVQRVRQWVADFVVCKSDFEPLAVLELDRAPPRAALSDRERRKNALLHAAGLKVIRISGSDIPNESALKALVAALPHGVSTTQLMRRAC